MIQEEKQQHWDTLYQTKLLCDVSWYQPTPETSLRFIQDSGISKSAKIIDVGGGDSFLVDHLLNLGYRDITVLDISEKALKRAQERLGDKAHLVKWIVTDIVNFQPTEKYDFWHDRAAFHFLTRDEEINRYVNTAHQYLSSHGMLVVGTFSDHGPKKCSGLEIKQYTEHSMTETFGMHSQKLKCITLDHHTPSGNIQNFIFCSFRKWEHEDESESR
ncbi:MAG: class I SAM-dependent methyltransferase [Bacteroidia bacterium]|jgi:ubiquinone/menaquinone biosynthesis C-methylase UbiE